MGILFKSNSLDYIWWAFHSCQTACQTAVIACHGHASIHVMPVILTDNTCANMLKVISTCFAARFSLLCIESETTQVELSSPTNCLVKSHVW